MEHLLTMTAANPSAAVAGLLAMACLVAWPLFAERSTMLLVYLGNNLAFALHYALLDQWTAVAMNGLMAVQTLVAIRLDRQPGMRAAYLALMPIVAVACLATWQGPPSVLSATATMLSTFGRLQRNESLFRALLLASTPFWGLHDWLVGSLPGLAADVLSMASGAAMLLQHAWADRRARSHAARLVALQKTALEDGA